MSRMLHDKLDELRALHHRTARRRRVMQAAWIWLGALAAAAVADAAWSAIGAVTSADPLAIVDAPAPLRACLAAALWIGAVVVVMRWRLPRSIGAMPDWRYARLCEQRRQLPGNPLVNAVQVEASGDGLSAELAERARRIGDEQAQQIDATDIIDTAPARRARHRLMGVGGLWAAIVGGSIALPGPNPLVVGLGRLAMPWADRPPYAMVELEASVAPEPVAVGDDPTVRLQTSGRAVSAARLRLGDGRTVGLSRREGAFTVRLSDVRRELRYAVEAGGTRTPWRRIEPVRLPRLEGVRASVRMDGQDQALRWPPPQPVRALAGASLRVEVMSSRSDARIDLPAARGLELTVPIEPGEQTVEFGLRTPQGLQSRRRVRIELIGLSPSRMQALAEAAGQPVPAEQAISVPLVAEDAAAGAAAIDASDGAMAQLSSGRPAEGSTSGDREPGGTTTQQTGEGSGSTGSGTGADAEGTDPPQPTEAVETMLERMNVPAEERGRVRAFAAAAPRAYREMVARYFLRLAETESP